jgi:16S rRNA (guanine527-N7)-methyltransferase
MTPETQLRSGITALGLDIPEAAQRKLLDYVALIGKWNETYNLTAVRDRGRMVSHHLLDCLAVMPHVPAPTLADVGSGAGLPGIPFAICNPAWRVTLIEANHKKAAFLDQARIELELGNVEVQQTRVESCNERRYEVVISRAFSDLPEFVRLAGHLLEPGGRLLALKGVHPHEEIAQLPDGYAVEQTLALQVPGITAARHLIIVRSGG